jgi:hypothetical protein
VHRDRDLAGKRTIRLSSLPFFFFFESAFDISFARKVQIYETPRPRAVYRNSYAMEQDAGPMSKR